MSRNERLTSTWFGSFLPSLEMILCFAAFRTAIHILGGQEMEMEVKAVLWRGEMRYNSDSGDAGLST
jgi:hypothetical protein